MEIGERIKIVRKLLNLSQMQFGNSLGVTKSAISTYETGIRNPTDRIVKSICSEYKINYLYLTLGEGDIFRSPTGSILDDLAIEYNLNQLEQSLLSEYLQLSITERKVITNYLNKVFVNQTNKTTC